MRHSCQIETKHIHEKGTQVKKSLLYNVTLTKTKDRDSNRETVHLECLLSILDTSSSTKANVLCQNLGGNLITILFSQLSLKATWQLPRQTLFSARKLLLRTGACWQPFSFDGTSGFYDRTWFPALGWVLVVSCLKCLPWWKFYFSLALSSEHHLWNVEQFFHCWWLSLYQWPAFVVFSVPFLRLSSINGSR